MLLIFVLAGAMPPLAGAHELSVVPPGSAKIDVGTVAQPRLIHLTLERESDTLTLTTAADGPLDLLLLAPSREPELSQPTNELPSLTLVSASGAPAPTSKREGELIDDEATGLRYLLRERTTIPAGQWTITVVRGTESARVAIWIGDPKAPFATSDLRRTPRALVNTTIWHETPAAGAQYVAPRGRATSAPSTGFAIYGAVLALIAVLTAIWWIRGGRARSRVRGIERSRDEDAS